MPEILIHLCARCTSASTDPLARNPMHLVHPVDATVMLFDVHGEAHCPTCGAIWRRTRNEVELVSRPQIPLRRGPIRVTVAKPAPAVRRKPGGKGAPRISDQ